MRNARLAMAVVAAGLAVAVTAAETLPPEGVSPGARDRISLVEGRCPTFTWGSVERCTYYELVAYRLPAGLESLADVDLTQAVEALYVQVPGRATAWTPGVERALEPGARYVWFVRAVLDEGDGGVPAAGEWSEGRFFAVAAAPSAAEVEQALAVLRRHLDARGRGTAHEVPWGISGDAGQVQKSETRPAPTGGDSSRSVPTAIAAIRGDQPDPSGETYGVVGVSASPSGAGLGAANTGGGADLVLDGTADLLPDTLLSESGIDRPSESPQTFNVSNSTEAGMTLQVDGIDVVTSLTDQDTLGGLSCSDGEVAKWDGASWACAPDDDTGGAGTVTSIDSGTGLTGGPITTIGTLAIDTAVVPQLGESNTFTQGQTIQSGAAATNGLVVQGASGQSANLQEWQDSTGAAVASVSAAGAFTASSFSGGGVGLTSLDADSLTSGTVSPAVGGSGLDTSSTAAGSLLYTGSVGIWAALPKGSDGEVLKLSGGLPAWAADNTGGAGTVTSVDSGTGLTGGPITTIGTLAIDTAVVPQLGESNTFTQGQTIQGAAAATNGLVVQGASGQSANLQEWQDSTGAAVASVSATGAFTGDGSGLTGISAEDFSGSLNGDVTGTQSATTVAKIQGTTVSSTSPSGGQVMRYNPTSTEWEPGAVVLSSSSAVSGVLGVANGGTGASTAAGALTSLNGASLGDNTFTGTQTVDTGGPVNNGLLVKGASGQVANLQEWQDSTGAAVASVSATGAFTGDGSGLTGISAEDFSGSLTGDVTGTQSATTVAKIQGTTVSSTSPSGGQVMRYNPTSTEWEPGAVLVSSSSAVSGVLGVANGGTGASTAEGALTSLNGASLGDNTFAGTQKVHTGGAADNGLVVKGASGQVANLQEWRDASDVLLSAIDSSGEFTGTCGTCTSATTTQNAELLDSLDSSDFAQLAAANAFLGAQSFGGTVSFANSVYVASSLSVLSGASLSVASGASVSVLGSASLATAAITNAIISGGSFDNGTFDSGTFSGSFSGDGSGLSGVGRYYEAPPVEGCHLVTDSGIKAPGIYCPNGAGGEILCVGASNETPGDCASLSSIAIQCETFCVDTVSRTTATAHLARPVIPAAGIIETYLDRSLACHFKGSTLETLEQILTCASGACTVGWTGKVASSATAFQAVTSPSPIWQTLPGSSFGGMMEVAVGGNYQLSLRAIMSTAAPYNSATCFFINRINDAGISGDDNNRVRVLFSTPGDLGTWSP